MADLTYKERSSAVAGIECPRTPEEKPATEYFREMARAYQATAEGRGAKILALTSACRDALNLCEYLERHWPEVGSLPATQDTKRLCNAAILGWEPETSRAQVDRIRVILDAYRNGDNAEGMNPPRHTLAAIEAVLKAGDR